MGHLLARNAAYAQAHGFEHHFFNEATVDLPVYWQKVYLCRQVLAAGYDIAIWADTDAVFHDFGRGVESLFQRDEVMVGAPDNPYWEAPFNAGVFAVRGTGGIALMDRWLGLFHATAWTRTETAWVCAGEWGGIDFEQGAFNAHLFDEAVVSGALSLVDWRVLQSPFPVPGALTLHFAGEFKRNLPAYLQSILG